MLEHTAEKMRALKSVMAAVEKLFVMGCVLCMVLVFYAV